MGNIFAEIEKIIKLREDIKSLSKDAQSELLYWLFLDGSIDYVEASKKYVQALETKKADQMNQIVEAETIILEDMIDREPGHRKTKRHMEWLSNHIQRALYFLNMGRRTNMESLNKSLCYDEEKGKEMSWYERNKDYEANGGYNYGKYS